MRNTDRLFVGLIITIVIYFISIIFGAKININVDFVHDSFGTYTVMLFLSIIAIYFLKKYVNYKISFPALRKVIKPALIGFIVSIVVNILMNISIKILGGNMENHPALMSMSPIQIFVFVVIYASVAEELLFRGFLMNILRPLKGKGIKVIKRRVSIPVMISAIAFGLAHLFLIKTGVGFLFLLRIVVFTTILGLVAGYYQEKYNNNAYAIIVHMAGNLMGLVAAILMGMN